MAPATARFVTRPARFPWGAPRVTAPPVRRIVLDPPSACSARRPDAQGPQPATPR